MSAISSDSELDEFVDALDETPVVPNLVPRVESPVEQTDDVQEEEKRLLKLQKKAEDRRKREDEEIKKRWEDVKRKKEEERILNIEEQKWKAEELLRRRKLEEMRQRMLEEATPTKSHNSSSSEDDYPVWEDGSDSVENSEPIDFKIQNFDQSLRDSEISRTSDNLVDNFKDVSSYTNLHDNRNKLDDNSLNMSTAACEHVTECSEGNASKFDDFSQNRDLSLPSKEKASKYIPEITCKDYEVENSDIVRHEHHEDVQVEKQTSEDYHPEPTLVQEVPDIVKSANPRNPPQSLMPPVAPPRRKKKKESCSSSSLSPEAHVPPASSNLLGSPGLPPAVPTPTSTVELLTRDLENSLDIQSAIGGRRHINAQDAEIGAVNSDHSSPASDQAFTPTETAVHSKLLEQPIPEETDLPSADSQENKEKTTLEQGEGQAAASDMPDPMGRPRSNSGRLLTDEEILEMVTVLNLDTGEKVPLNLAEDALPQCMNPLALHIMRRTKEYNSDTSLHKEQTVESDDDDTKPGVEKTATSIGRTGKWKATKIKRFIGKTVVKTVSKVKSVADQSKKVLQGDDVEEEVSVDGKRFKFKACSHNKGPYDFSQFRILQDLGGEHTGAVWTMKFSPCGRLLATGGQDNVLRIWVLKSAYAYFEDLRQKYSDVRVSPSPSPAPSQESLDSLNTSEAGSTSDAGGGGGEDETSVHVPFIRKPFCTYRGHSADLLDVSWSKNYFILSSSMDKTVRLWHISRRECLCTFQHIDFVTAIVFHPRDDRYFLSGSLDGKLRLWNIPDKKVTLWNEVSGPSNLITTANFCQNGKFAVVGTYDGKCIFYSTDQLKYYTQIHVRSTRGKNARGRKITGIEPMLGEDRILVTSNDSRIRLYDLRDLTLTCKYKGGSNNSSQIKSSFSPKGKYIICGSEDHFIYIWKTQHELYKFSSARRDRNDFWEAIKVHNAVVTAAIFAPCPSLFAKPKDEATEQPSSQESEQGEIIISVDFTGMIKVIQNKVIVN